MNKAIAGVIYLLIATFFIAGNFIVGQYARNLVPPWQLAFFRFFIGLLVMLPFLASSFIKHIHIINRHWHHLFIQGFLGVMVAGGFAYESLLSTSASNGGFIFASSPIFTFIFAWMLLGEVCTKRQALGVLITLIGVMGIISEGKPQALLALKFGVGDLWMLANAICYALYTVFIRKFKIDLPPAVFLMSIMITGCILLLFPSLYEIVQGQFANLTSIKVWMTLLYAGIFTAAIGYFFYIKGTHLAGAKRAGILIYAIPVFVAIQAYFFLGDELHLYHYISAFIMAIGIYLTF